MHITRFIGGLFAIFLVLAISYFTDIEFINVVAMSGFVLAVDSLIIKYMTKLYMQALLDSAKKDEDEQ